MQRLVLVALLAGCGAFTLKTTGLGTPNSDSGSNRETGGGDSGTVVYSAFDTAVPPDGDAGPECIGSANPPDPCPTVTTWIQVCPTDADGGLTTGQNLAVEDCQEICNFTPSASGMSLGCSVESTSGSTSRVTCRTSCG